MVEITKIRSSIVTESKDIGTAIKAIAELHSMLSEDIKVSVDSQNKSAAQAAQKLNESNQKMQAEKAKLDANSDYKDKQVALSALEAKNLPPVVALKAKKEVLEKSEAALKKAAEDAEKKSVEAKKKAAEEADKLAKSVDYKNMKDSLEGLRNVPATTEQMEKKQEGIEKIKKDIMNAEKASKQAAKEGADAEAVSAKQKSLLADKSAELKDITAQSEDASNIVKLKSEIAAIEKPYSDVQKEVSGAAAVMQSSAQTSQELQSMSALLEKLSGPAFNNGLKEGDIEALSQLKDMASSYSVFAPEKFIDSVYEERNKSREQAKKFAANGSEACKLLDAAHELSQYGSKTRRKTSTVGNDKAYAIGQKLGMKSIDEQLQKTMAVLQNINVDKLIEEVKTTEREYAKAAILDKTADEINKTTQVGKIKISAASTGRAYLEKLTEKDVKDVGLSKDLEIATKQAVQQASQQAKAQSIKDVIVETIVTSETENDLLAMYQKRSEKLSNLVNSLGDKSDTKTIRQINSGMIQMFAEIKAITEEEHLSEGAETKLKTFMDALNKEVKNKAAAVGTTSEAKIVTAEHSERMRQHVRDMRQKDKQEVESVSTATYNDLINIFSKAYGIKKDEILEQLEEFIARQNELRDTLRGPRKRAKVDLSSPEVIAEQQAPNQPKQAKKQPKQAQAVTEEEKKITGSKTMQELMSNIADVGAIKATKKTFTSEEAIAGVIFYAQHKSKIECYAVSVNPGAEPLVTLNAKMMVEIPKTVDSDKVKVTIGVLEKESAEPEKVLTRTFGLRETAERVCKEQTP
jgi:hypothetical protein